MEHVGIHPAAGVGAFIPGFFYQPENPVRAGERGYAHYVPDARLRIASSHAAPASALAKSLDQAGAFEGSAYDLAGLGGCSCVGGKVDFGGGDEALGGVMASFLGNGGLPTWAHIAIGASLAAVVVGLIGVRRR